MLALEASQQEAAAAAKSAEALEVCWGPAARQGRWLARFSTLLGFLA